LDFFLVALPHTLLDQQVLDREFPRCVEKGVGVVIGAVFASGILATRRGARCPLRLRAGNAGDAGEGGAHRGGVRAPRCAARGGSVAIPVGPPLGRLGDTRRSVARAREPERCRIPSPDPVVALGGAETGRPAASRRTDTVACGRRTGLPSDQGAENPYRGRHRGHGLAAER
jgi:hypothetical protein